MLSTITLSMIWAVSAIEITPSEDEAMVDAILAEENDNLVFDAERAIRACQHALEARQELTRVEKARLWHFCASAHANEQRVREALKAAEEAFRLNPNDQEIEYQRVFLRTVYWRNSKPLVDYLKAHPDDPRALAVFAQILAGNGQFDKALEFVDRAVTAAGTDLERLPLVEYTRFMTYKHQRDHQKALQAITRVIELWPHTSGDSLANHYVERAEVYLSLGDKAEAEADMGRALRLASKNRRALRGLFFIKCQRSQYHAATHLAQKYLRIDKKSEESRYLLAVAHFAVGRDQLADQTLEQIPAEGEYADWVETLRGSLAMAKGNTEEAVERYRGAIKGECEDPRALLGLAYALSVSEDRDAHAEEIRTSVERGLERYSKEFKIRTGGQAIQALILGNLGDFDEAVTILKGLDLDDLAKEYRDDLQQAIKQFGEKERHEPKVCHLRLMHTDA